jgi:hypothetical protein
MKEQEQEQKTGAEILQMIGKIDPEIAERIKANHDLQNPDCNLLSLKFESGTEMIRGVFEWAITPQGYEYWQDQSYKYLHIH